MKFLLIFTIFALNNGQMPMIETQEFRSLENCKIVGDYLVKTTIENDKYRRYKKHVSYKCIELKTIRY